MGSPRTVGVIVGSLRKESYNRKVARALIAMAPPALQLTFVEIGDLPLYNQDLEESPPGPWVAFRDRIRALDAVLFVTPEYNRGMPAAVKNAVDVGSRPPGHNVWGSKPAAIVSVTPGGLGAMASHQQLRQAIFAVGMSVLSRPEMYIGNVGALLGPDGAVTNDKTRELLDKFLKEFASWIERCLASVPAPAA